MYENRLLSQLHRRSSRFGNDRVKLVTYNAGHPISEVGQSIETVLFPGSGIISVVTPLDDGSVIETAMVGHDGAIGASVLFGATTHSFQSFVQVPGSVWVMRAKDLIEIAEQDRSVAPIMFQAEVLLSAEAQQTAACNAKHQAQQRLATWLLRTHDATGARLFHCTQDFMAAMLGLQRATVSILASQLQVKGLIQYRRGRIELLDLNGLEQAACECYADLRRTRNSIFGNRHELTDSTVQSHSVMRSNPQRDDGGSPGDT